MEASERPQLPLDEPGEAGTVRALDGRIVIRDLTVDDERAAHLVRERQQLGKQPADTVRKAIEIGARVLDSEETAANVDYVRAEFGRRADELRERLAKTLEQGDVQLAERLAASFDAGREGSVPQAIESRVGAALTEQREALLKLFSAQEGSNPLFDFKDAMVKVYRELGTRQQQEGEENRRVIAELRKELLELKERTHADERVAMAESAGTRKGFSFEERVDAAIERIATARGDCASHTGAESAEGGGKKGDTLVEVGAAAGPAVARIVFEAKDAERLSKNKAWGYLNESIDKRAASFGVLVVASGDQVPSGREPLQEYEGNKLIVAVDRDEPDGLALEIAYRLAVARVTMARDRELTVDPAEVRAAAEEALSCLKQAQAVRSALTGIKTSSDRARSGLDEMEAAVRAKLERIDALVAEAEPDPD